MQALEERGIPYVSKRVDLFNGESLLPQFLVINPAGTVPVLVSAKDSSPLTQSRHAAL